jgi:hypothetical protein
MDRTSVRKVFGVVLIVLLLDGHASPVTPRVRAVGGANGICIIGLVPHSFHVSQPLDLCVFGLFKSRYEKENKLKLMKGETLKIFRAVMAFDKATIIRMVRWNFISAGLGLNPENLFVPMSISRMKVLERIAHPDVPIEEFLGSEANRAPGDATGASRRRWAIPGPSTFAISLHAYVEKVAGTCPRCSHSEEKHSFEEWEPGPDSARPLPFNYYLFLTAEIFAPRYPRVPL